MPPRDERTVAIVLAAGEGSRLGGEIPKAFLEIEGTPMVVRAVRTAAACELVEGIVVAVPAGLHERAGEIIGVVSKPVTVVAGGSTRHASVRNALATVPGEVDVVLCHDAARPFARSELFAAVVRALDGADGAIPVLTPADTVKHVQQGIVLSTEPREEIGLAQTPQAFSARALRDAHERAATAGREFTDDAAALEWAGYRVRAIPGDPENIKITVAGDLARTVGSSRD